MLRRNIKFIKNNYRNFSTKEEITYKPNEKDETILEIYVPEDLQSSYSFANINRLPIYENFSNSKNYQSFIPLPKTNILILSAYTIMSYSTLFFQPALLLTLYALKKYFL